MFKKMFSGGAAFLCLSLVLCAKVGSAQSCQRGAYGYYAYSAVGTGMPGALLTTGASNANPAYSNTTLGQLLADIANAGPFAASGTLYLDGSGNVRASAAAGLIGSYVVHSDCTIAVTLMDAFGTNTTVTTLQGIILAGGSEIDLGVLQNVSTGSSPAIGAYQSNLLIKLFKPLTTYCNIASLTGSYGLIATGNRVVNATAGSGAVIVPGQTVAPFFLIGRVQFDGNGNILPQAATPSSLSFLQFAGSYTVNADCTGTMTLGSNTVAAAFTIPGPTLSANFVLTQPSVTGGSTGPDIQFNLFNGAETLSGRGQVQ
jgi:hypothetical protein